MDVMEFLNDKPRWYQEKFLAAVSAHRAGDLPSRALAVDELMAFHATADKGNMRRLLTYLVEMAAEMSDIDEMVMESYANHGPSSPN